MAYVIPGLIAAVVVGLLTGGLWWLRLRTQPQQTDNGTIDTTALENAAHIDAALYSGAPNRFASLQSWGITPRSSTHRHGNDQ